MKIDFGLTAADYARHRAGFPDSIYEHFAAHGVGKPEQLILDLGTGTGTLARGFAARGCRASGESDGLKLRATGEAESLRQRGAGEADAIRARGNGEAEAIRATGDAKAEAYRAGLGALGSNAYTILQIM